MTERAIIAVWLALFAVVCAFGLGCGVKAKGIEQKSGRDSKAGTAEAKINTSQPVNSNATASQPATITSSGSSNPTTGHGASQNTATGGWLNFQYAPAIGVAGGTSVLALWLVYSWRLARLNRDGEIKIAELDLERDRLTIETLAKMRDCQAGRPPCDKKE